MTRLVILAAALLGACAVDADQALPTRTLDQAPLPQSMGLIVEGSEGGQPLTFRVAGAPPNANVKIARAVGGGISTSGPCPPQLGGECVDINGPNGVQLFGFTIATDAAGNGSITITIPSGVVNGTSVGFQAIIPALALGSNPVNFTVGPVACINLGIEPNDNAFLFADTLYNGDTGTVCPNDFDWFTLDLFAGDTLTVDANFTQIPNQVNLDLYLRDSPSDNISFGADALAGGISNTDNETAQIVAASDDVHYILLHNRITTGTMGGEYWMTYVITPAVP